jgi:hypothetical protein
MAKISESSQIEFIKACLRKGLKRKAILGKFGKKWETVSRTTFDRRLKQATESMQGELKPIEQRTEESIAVEVEARKSKILTSIERQEILSKIALGQLPLKKLIVCDGIIEEREVVPDWMDRKNAIAELNKMDGSYSPAKVNMNINKVGLDVIEETYE